MLFNSIEFLIFFPIVTILFYLIPHNYRWIHLLAASCFFYMFFVPQYILILLITIVIDYVAALLMEKTEGRRRKVWLVVSICSTCLVLIIFKYLGFFHENMILLSHKLGFPYPEKAIHIILPIGLSFHTFQSLSYVIEVYRKNQKAERHFGIYSLYVMFYPQLVTGPIERPQNLLRQLRERQHFENDNLIKGLRLVLFGLFVKMVIADNLAVYVDQIYENPALYSTRSIFTGLFFYSFQIYCDFFGYSTIALGCARAMGFYITDNFKTPYLAKNISEFWHKWHISLSTWFRDYVYFPLGGSRVKIPRWMINIMIVFILSGFWHGANWTFILWGFAYGVLFILERLWRQYIHFPNITSTWGNRIWNGLCVVKNFILVTLIWVLFRATSLQHIKDVAKASIANIGIEDSFVVEPKMWFFLAVFILFDVLIRKSRFDSWCSGVNGAIRWLVYAFMIFSIIVFSSVENFPFIYFQF